MSKHEKLNNQLSQATRVEERLYLYYELVDNLLYRNQQLAQQYIEAGLELAMQHNLYAHQAFCLYNQVIIYTLFRQTQKQFETILRLAQLLTKIEDKSLYYCLMGMTITVLPIDFNEVKTAEKTLEIYLKSLEYFDQTETDYRKKGFNSNFKALIYQGISFVYLQLQNKEKTLAYLKLAAFFVELGNYPSDKTELCRRWAFVHWKFNNPTKCIEYSQKALEISYGMHDTKELIMDIKDMQLFMIQGIVYLENLKNYPQALQCFEKSIRICDYFNKQPNPYTADLDINIANLYKYIGRVYEALGDWQQAYLYAQKSIKSYMRYTGKQSNEIVSLAQELLQMGIKGGKRNTALQIFWEQHPPKLLANEQDTDSLKFYEYIESRCGEQNLGVEEIAQHFNMSCRTLNRHVQKIFGLSPQKIINFIRLQRAYWLLGDTNKTIAEVAEMVGFEHLSYFGKLFKKQFGFLPSQLRMSQKL
jgi:AraC-like DNA-binding protein